jgi:Rieske Fe-S protein
LKNHKVLDFGNDISRKKFIKILGAILVLPLTGAWLAMTKKAVVRNASANRYVDPLDIPQGTGIFDEMITYRKGNEVRFFSSRCTHLGCRIDKKIGDELVCPCHGSRFDACTGNNLRGPANKGLNELEYKLADGKFIVKINR